MGLRLMAAATLLAVTPALAELPTLGSANASQAQLQQEYELGRSWVRLVKARVELINDPVIEAYLKQLTWRLVPYSELQDKRLEILVIDNREINAFAAPGGILGIHAGLLAQTHREDELASVIAHEFAHLSQRHFAQQQNAAEQRTPWMLAGMLGGLLLSSINPSAGAAAIQGSLGASVSSQLAFSRKNELDADQTGMQTLVNAGFDPQAMPRMFSLLQESSRFSGGEVPEFLRTHPVTQSRIADSSNRAAQMPSGSVQVEDSQSYLIARARAQVHYGINLSPQPNTDDTADRLYGFFNAISERQHQEAMSAYQALPETLQMHPWVELGLAELNLNTNRLEQAKTRIDELYALYPDDRAIQKSAASFWVKTGNLAQAAQLYRDLIRDEPENPELWFQLAELCGLLNQPERLHRARIEYFLVRGDFDLALRQVEFARRDAPDDGAQKAWLDQRELEIRDLRTRADALLN